MPASTYEPLASVTLTSQQLNITFSNIPQNYTDLVLVANVKAISGQYPILLMQLNGDTSAVYSRTWLLGDGTSPASGRQSGFNQAYPGPGTAGGISDNANTFSTGIINIMNYSNNTTFKTILSRDAIPYNSATLNREMGLFVNLWRKTAAVTSILISTNNGNSYDVGSTFSLYGIAANTLKATGGNIITTDGTYWYHAFTSSGTFTPKTSLTCDYLVVAGGGGGGGNNAGSGGSGGGGGGAGGLRSTVTATGGGGSLESALSLSADVPYTVTIGAGGAGGIANIATAGQNGTNGSNTTFSTITSTGGGGGGGQDLVGSNGGSGGGGGSNDKAGGTRVTNQGFAGGSSGNGSTAYRGGGGGGAGVAGTSGVSVAPVGGNGVSISQLASVTGTGVSNFYAGGGGGGSYNGLPGIGGAGGGGAGSQQGDGGYGVPNTGSGGGGAGYNGYAFGGNGGSGIVIVRYAV